MVLARALKDDTIITVRVKTPKLAVFDLKCGTKSRAEVIRQLMDKFCEDTAGPLVDFDAMKAECLKLKKTEYTLAKLLQDEICDKTRKTAYETMIYFAIELGTDATLQKNIEQTLKKLIEYQWTTEDTFRQSNLNTFIDYVETVLKRRALETEIAEIRRKNNHITK